MIDYFTNLPQLSLGLLTAGSVLAISLFFNIALTIKLARTARDIHTLQNSTDLANQRTELTLNQLAQEQARAKHIDERLQQTLREASRWESLARERERSLELFKNTTEHQKSQLAQQFENLATRIFHDQGQKFSQTQEYSVKQLLAPMRDQLQAFSQQVTSFQQSHIHSQASLSNELGHLKELNRSISKEAHDLTKALKGDKKLTGIWGELQLEKSLQAAGLTPNVHYEKEKSIVNAQGKRLRPDFIIHLPDNKKLIIDSKVSLVAFEQAISADDQELEEQALQWHIKALKKHVDELANKDYSALLGHDSPHFVFMYIGIEPAYIEALRVDPALYDYGISRNIVMTSHTTLMPILKTVANLWLHDRSHTQAFELAEKAGEIYEQVNTVAARLQKLGRSLQTTSNYYNETVIAIAGKQGLYGKIERFGDLSKSMTPQLELSALDYDIDHMRLDTNVDISKRPKAEETL